MEFADRNRVDQMNTERDSSIQEELVVAENGNVSWIDSEGEKEVLEEGLGLKLEHLATDGQTVYTANTSGPLKDLRNGDVIIETPPEAGRNNYSKFDSVEVHEGDIYFSNSSSIFNRSCEEVRETWDGVGVSAMESHEGSLIYGTLGGQGAFDVFSGEKVEDPGVRILEITGTDDGLYLGLQEGIDQTYYVESPTGGKTELERINGMTEVNGEVYVATDDVVYRDLDEEFFHTENGGYAIDDIVSVPRDVVEELLGGLR